MVLSFVLIQNRQGKTRLAKWYAPYNDEEKIKLKGEVHRLIAPRDQKYQSNFVEFRQNKIVYRRYAGLFFCVCVDANDNELAYLEAIHFFVEVLDSFFGNVCELDLVFNFYKVRWRCRTEMGRLAWEEEEKGLSDYHPALSPFSSCALHPEPSTPKSHISRITNNPTQVYAILDEVFLAGEIEETSKQVVLTRLEHLDKLE
ncbi:hypothetical protein HYALB_00002707 [Hymenoscyphus albidus]|uniref:AP complex subunit sigma n=1 Tax=Hymenoscyphus albidus TaxID=595503 RepID=A0A9N9LXT4_9HELO|nr:hypothetical protein HYALB_00002707 [Hymenoscyphus albidus]